LKSITYPVPGNHEYKTRGASGYFRYFHDQQPGSPGYYTRTIGAWQIFALNSNCDNISCHREYRWLRRNIAENPSTCSLFMMHHPRFSSGGEHGSSTAMRRFFSIADRHGVELILAGHDHDYERFTKMNADGEPRRNGVIQIVSGAGGKSLYRLGPRVDGSVYAEDSRYGVLKLSLASSSFSWAYKTLGGGTPDSGSRGCR
jgi:3',5'-cyclic AMP phosphodiesterase CpdA